MHPGPGMAAPATDAAFWDAKVTNDMLLPATGGMLRVTTTDLERDWYAEREFFEDGPVQTPEPDVFALIESDTEAFRLIRFGFAALRHQLDEPLNLTPWTRKEIAA